MNKIKQMLIISFCLAVAIAVTNSAFAEDDILTFNEAIAIALETVNTEEVGEITSIEIETEDNVLVYAVEFAKDDIETDVKINAETGEVIEIKSDLDEIGEE